MDLGGKVALVTGGARGLGRGIARALAQAGCDVAVADLGRATDGATPYELSSRDDLAETAREIERLGRRSLRILADVTSAADVARMADEVERGLGGLDILVANAGVIAAAPVAAMEERLWDHLFAVNTKGVFLCARAAIPLLARRGGGRIVNIASVAGKTGRAGLSAYCASKAAVISFTQALAEEVGPMNVTVNAICPGFIDTAMFKRVLSPVLASVWKVPEAELFERFVTRQTFLRRGQTPDDIGEAAVYLCRADNVTGVTLTVAGGGEVH
jgi:meso-butanediol dehydrogenase / (S,S)-butanediol dehydrogenase / diacetyl reductase